jgi:hypothetical protein
MGRMILSAAALYNAAGVLLLLFRPGTILLKPPPLFGGLIAGIGLGGAALALCAVTPRRALLALAIPAKIGAADSFPLAAGLGDLGWTQGWVPPLLHLWKRTGSS